MAIKVIDRFYIVGRESEGTFRLASIQDILASQALEPSTLVRHAYTQEENPADLAFIRYENALLPSPDPETPAGRSEPEDRAHGTGGAEGSVENVVDAKGWSTLPVSPWRRFGARILDSLFYELTVGTLFTAIYFAAVADEGTVHFINTLRDVFAIYFLTFVFSFLISGLFVGTLGATPGKYMFGIKVLSAEDMRPIGFGNAVYRELQVFVFGFWFGIPLLSLIGLFLSYRRLKQQGDTRWDAGECVVLTRPAGTTRDRMTLTGILIIVALIVLW